MTEVACNPPPTSKLSSRDASTRLIETQEAFILSLSLTMPLFYLPFLFLPLPLHHHPPPPSFCPYSSRLLALSICLCLFVADAIFPPFLAIHPSPPSLTNELNVVLSQGVINCDNVLRMFMQKIEPGNKNRALHLALNAECPKYIVMCSGLTWGCASSSQQFPSCCCTHSYVAFHK